MEKRRSVLSRRANAEPALQGAAVAGLPGVRLHRGRARAARAVHALVGERQVRRRVPGLRQRAARDALQGGRPRRRRCPAALPVLAAGDTWGRAARRCGDTLQGRLQGGATATLPPRNLLALAGLARPGPRAGRASPRTARPQLWCPGSAALLALCTWGGCEAPQGCAARRGAPQRPYGELFSSWRAKLGYKSRRPIFLPRPRICCCRAAVNGARRRGR